MFRPSPGFTAQYHGMTLLVVLDFDQWRIFLQGPGVIIDGGCQNDKADAKAVACRIADQYISKQGRDAAMPPFALVEWTPLESHAFLVWQAQGQPCGSSREVAKLAAQKGE
jgi:hypothetical protein